MVEGDKNEIHGGNSTDKARAISGHSGRLEIKVGPVNFHR